MEMKTTSGAEKKLRSNYAMVLIPLCVAINIVGGLIANQLKLPVYLDCIGTCLSAIIVGPVLGIVTAVVTQIICAIINAEIAPLIFALVQIAVAIIVGVAAQKNFLSKWWHIVPLSIITAVIAALVAAPVSTFLFGGVRGQGADFIIAGLMATGQSVFSSSFIASLGTNIADKAMALVICFIIMKRLPDNMKNLTGATSKD